MSAKCLKNHNWVFLWLKSRDFGQNFSGRNWNYEKYNNYTAEEQLLKVLNADNCKKYYTLTMAIHKTPQTYRLLLLSLGLPLQVKVSS